MRFRTYQIFLRANYMLLQILAVQLVFITFVPYFSMFANQGKYLSQKSYSTLRSGKSRYRRAVQIIVEQNASTNILPPNK